MRCPKCRSEVFGDEKFCRYCGQSLTTTVNDQPSLNPSIPIYNQSSNTQQNTASNQYNYQANQMYNNSEDEILLNEYIGKKAEEIKANKFNYSMFFWGILYLFYRKMWLYAFALLAVTTISMLFLAPFALVISIGASIYLAKNFTKLYLSHAKDQIRKIKFDNSDKTTEQLIPIVRKKGGTSILAPILYLILCILFFVGIVISFIYMFEISGELFDEIEKDTYTEKIVYEVPESFKPLYETLTYNSYNYLENGETCSLSISSSFLPTYNKEDYYLNNTLSSYNAPETTEVQTININNNEWKNVKINVGSSIVDYYVYVSENNRSYEIKFIKYNGETPGCDSAFNSFVQTIDFVEQRVD